MRALLVVCRILAAGAITVAIVSQYAYSAANSLVNPFNFFGYFTEQSGIIAAVGFYLSAVLLVGRKAQPRWLIYLRAQAVVVMSIVGLVYNTLLAGGPEDPTAFTLPWTSTVLHVVMPIYVVLDWIVFADRPALPFARFWLMLIYPIVWVAVILVRGLTDGWVPYPFLDPVSGYGSVLVYVGGIFVVAIVLAVIVYALSRVRLLRP